MNDDQLEDLKQLIETTAANTETNLKKDMVTKKDLQEGLYGLETRLIARMNDGFAGAGDATTTANDDVDNRLEKLEDRVNTLEQAA